MDQTRTPKFEYASRSYWFLIFLTMFEISLLVSAYNNPTSLGLWLLVAALLFLSFNITTVTVQADREVILVTYGIGLVQRLVYVSEISKLRIRPNNTIFAMYTGASEQALEITERSGRVTVIGIGETRKMLEYFKGQARGE